ncbi:LacI family DNA-binding transcriptional regulator [Yoonia sp.]|uniref:LacI family DNA-binding transcriptional regulator n=1 Tax=Yoonia sp. TaxID=2212373 RepID=UPI0019F44EBF|nr:LacI family DNA-binding transcriptional regulator [Yoonia sp.]MBE0414637.1 LacI family DNA-binding transcriptional regulator [Yoonia sp.]
MDHARKLPTMTDVARKAGVSPMTVSRALKSDGLVSEDTRARILKAADELGYVLDSTASSLRSQKSDFVAVTIPSINNANFADTVGALNEGLKPRGLQILLGYTNYDMHEEERLIAQLLRRKPLAVVVTGGTHTPRCRRLLENAHVPVIETWDLPENPLHHVIGFSNAQAVQSMVDHFVAKGLTRIAFVGGDTDRDTRGLDRRRGFVAAMQRHGLDATRLIAAGPPPISMREGAEVMARLLDTAPDTQAVICVSDLSAFGALSACQRRGIAVPGQISIAGFGNFEVGAICVPSITTIDPSPKDIGARVARLICRVLDGDAPEPVLDHLAPRLLLRESSI